MRSRALSELMLKKRNCGDDDGDERFSAYSLRFFAARYDNEIKTIAIGDTTIELMIDCSLLPRPWSV